jgi:hypothetical protein
LEAANTAYTTRGYVNTCTTGLTLRGIGLNSNYYLGDNTATERNTVVSVDISALTAASDTVITDIWGSFYTTHIKTSTGKLYA